MYFIGVDLGTTNIKVVLYNEQLQSIASSSTAVVYQRQGKIVEFDAELYFDGLAKEIEACCAKIFKKKPYPISQIILTGQAESLVPLNSDGRPVRMAISWMDMRSSEECEELKKVFDVDTCYHITGQSEIIPTWPITKILWLRHHEAESYAATEKYLLLKDYIIYRMSGELAGDYSIYNFTHYFDIVKKEYWTEILDYCGVKMQQLPPLVPSCTVAGTANSKFRELSGVSEETKINVGTLDHFAGMIGTGNIHEGTISESTGTVLALATLLEKPLFNDEMVALHCGPFADTYVLLPVCESGGSSLEWFKRSCMPEISYSMMEEVLADRPKPGKLVFLPYITGANAPDIDMKASGVFFGCRAEHDAYDMALSVMEGVSHMLNKNIVAMDKSGIHVDHIVSTGGGARSALWCQMKADITGKTVNIPKDKEAACLGAAIIGAVSENVFKNFDEATTGCIAMEKQYTPLLHKEYKIKSELYNAIYSGLQDAFAMQPADQD